MSFNHFYSGAPFILLSGCSFNSLFTKMFIRAHCHNKKRDKSWHISNILMGKNMKLIKIGKILPKQTVLFEYPGKVKSIKSPNKWCSTLTLLHAMGFLAGRWNFYLPRRKISFVHIRLLFYNTETGIGAIKGFVNYSNCISWILLTLLE